MGLASIGCLSRLAPLAIAALLFSCATAPPRGPDQTPPARATKDPGIVALRAKLTEGARSVLGKKELVVRGKRFSYDCTGTVLAIYWYAGIDLGRDLGRFSGNGVTRLYKTLERENLLYSATTPLSGDIIFWDNTYDADGNGAWDDPLTHVGMVMSVDDDGTVAYIHQHVRNGIAIEHMNLRSPDVQRRLEMGRMKILNSPLRLARKGTPHPPNWLAGQLYRTLGMGYLFE